MPMTLRAVCAALLVAQGSALRLESHAQTVEEDASKWPTDWTTDDAIRILWYGYDVGHELQGFLERSPHSLYNVNKLKVMDFQQQPGGSPNLVVLSPKDSGLSLLMQTLELNYFRELEQACDWKTKWVDHDRPWQGHLFCRAYPHGLVTNNSAIPAGAESFYEVMRQQNQPTENTVVIFMVKSPLATLQSWSTSFREKSPCIKRPATQYNTECTSKDVTWHGWGNRVRDGEQGLKVKSTIDLYNQYMKMYHDIKNSGRFNQALFFTYEDFVEDPADVVLQIAGAMNWPPKGDISVIEGVRGEGGHKGYPAAGRPLMVEELHNRTWLGWTPKAIRDEWCAGLDFSTFDDLAENEFYIDYYPHVKYGFDCE